MNVSEKNVQDKVRAKMFSFVMWPYYAQLHPVCDSLCCLLQMLKISSKEKYPLFTFVNGHSRDFDFTSTATSEEDLFSEDEKKKFKRFSTEEFVLL